MYKRIINKFLIIIVIQPTMSLGKEAVVSTMSTTGINKKRPRENTDTSSKKTKTAADGVTTDSNSSQQALDHQKEGQEATFEEFLKHLDYYHRDGSHDRVMDQLQFIKPIPTKTEKETKAEDFSLSSEQVVEGSLVVAPPPGFVGRTLDVLNQLGNSIRENEAQSANSTATLALFLALLIKYRPRGPAEVGSTSLDTEYYTKNLKPILDFIFFVAKYYPFKAPAPEDITAWRERVQSPRAKITTHGRGSADRQITVDSARRLLYTDIIQCEQYISVLLQALMRGSLKLEGEQYTIPSTPLYYHVINFTSHVRRIEGNEANSSASSNNMFEQSDNDDNILNHVIRYAVIHE
jgi:hypothetical protein